MATQTLVDATMVATQPVVFGIAGMTYLGVAVNEWVLVGSAILLVLNLGLVPYKIYNEWKRSKR